MLQGSRYSCDLNTGLKQPCLSLPVCPIACSLALTAYTYIHIYYIILLVHIYSPSCFQGTQWELMSKTDCDQVCLSCQFISVQFGWDVMVAG